MDCTCHVPGHCPHHDRVVTPTGAKIWASGDERSIRLYFGEPVDLRPTRDAPRREVSKRGTCGHLGDPMLGPDGNPILETCHTCKGHVEVKIYECSHPLHDRTTIKECRSCPDFIAPDVLRRRPMQPVRNMGSIPVPMVAPSDRRPKIHRGGILQIMVTRACDLSCYHCTQGSNLAGRPAMMTPDEFEQACASLRGYFGIVGMFGGNPCIHPKFPELCKIMRAYFPSEQRGLWTNNLNGMGRHARITFNPRYSNINVHQSSEAAREIRLDWPEAAPFIKGESDDSEHGPPFVAMRDVVPDESERWKMIGDCDINKYWSAIIGVVPGRGLRAYFCEIAYAQAALHAVAEDADDWPDTGMIVEPEWWRRPMADFEAQVYQHCHACGIPLRRPGQMANGGTVEEFSATHRAIARPKQRARPVAVVESIGLMARPDRPATEYLPGITPRT